MCEAYFAASDSPIIKLFLVASDIYSSKQTFISLYPILKSALMKLYLLVPQIYRRILKNWHFYCINSSHPKSHYVFPYFKDCFVSFNILWVRFTDFFYHRSCVFFLKVICENIMLFTINSYLSIFIAICL